MQLDLDDNIITEDAQAIDVIEALDRLTSDGDSFAILSQNDMTYIQTSGDLELGFILEYQNGSTAEHYGCYQDLQLDTVMSYLNDDGRWRREIRREISGL